MNRKTVWTMTVVMSVGVIGAVGASANEPLILTPVTPANIEPQRSLVDRLFA